MGAGRAAAFLNVQPFVVLLLSWLILHEPVHAYHVAGAHAGHRRGVADDAPLRRLTSP